MFLDSQLQFSDAQALTATAASTNIVDTGPLSGSAANTSRDMFTGEALGVVITVDVAADATTGDETYQFDLQTDDNSGFSSATVIATRTIARTALTLNSQHVIPVPPEVNVEQFIRMNYVLGGTTPTITVTVHLQPLSMVQNYVSYADNIVIT